MTEPRLEPRWQLAAGYRIELFAQQDAVTDAQVEHLWRTEAGLSGAEARRRLSELLLVAVDRDQRLAGVATAYLHRSEQLSAQLWYLRVFVAAAHRQSNVAVGLALDARDHLQGRYLAGADRRAIGLVFEVEHEGLRRRFPEALWLPTDFLFIDETPNRAHVRVHYFPGAPAPEPPPALEAGFPPPSGYRIVPFASQLDVSAEDIVALWTRDAGLTGTEARRRVRELLLIALDGSSEPVGLCTAYLQRNQQLRAPMWYVRVFVVGAHRRLQLARALAVHARDLLSRRFASGADRRALGVAFEVASEALRRKLPQANWPETRFLFIGEGPNGSHVRVHYFPGALAPEPDQGSA